MFQHSYYVYHKVQIGKKGEITEAARLVTRPSKIKNLDDINQVIAALAHSHNVQSNHIMIAGWQYLGSRFAIIEKLQDLCLKALEIVNRGPSSDRAR